MWRGTRAGKKRLQKTKKLAKFMTEFFLGRAGEIEYVFSVTMIPRVEDRVRKDGRIWNGSYAMVTLLNLTRKTYFLPVDGTPWGWEYIAEKYNLCNEEAMGFTEILGRLLGLQVDLPKTYRLGERCLQVISGGLSK